MMALNQHAIEIVNVVFPYDQSVALFGLVTFLLSFIVLAGLELMYPARRGVPGRQGRISVNFGLGILNLMTSALLPISTLAVASLAVAQQWGLFQHWVVGWYISLPLLLLVRSLMDYTIHWVFHNAAWLWPLHAVHHRDDAIDLSTSFRTHPLSHLIVLFPNALLILVLGPDIWVLLTLEAFVFTAVLFQHANLRLRDSANERLERWLVTPRMHLVHHARDRYLHDSNYGEVFSFWDRYFGTYRAPPSSQITIGVEVRKPRD